MNHIYRLVWNSSRGAYVAVIETAKGRGKSSAKVSGSVAAVLLAVTAHSATLPTGGQVTAGAATISSSANTLTVNQSSQNTAINWQSFSIGSNGTVNFVQPNTSSVVLNRVVGTEQSVIAGAMNANGQVFLLNSNGVLFTGTSSVNVGGLVASTLHLSDADFVAGRRTFSANGSKASVINLGAINAADGGYVALLGNQVKNEGVITARLGTAIMAAGDQVSLNLNGDSLVGVTIDQGTLNALVENKQAIRADGGLVVLTAKGLDAVMATVVNNTGEVRAQTVANKEGKIYLLGEGGVVSVDGTLDASAPTGGNGGFIETSGSKVKIADTTRISTASTLGLNGTWLIDPVDFTIAATGDITGAALGTLLGSNSVTIQTSTGANTGTNRYGASGTNGDIFVNDAVSWSANTTLTLNAFRNININSAITASGASGAVALYYGQGALNSNNLATYSFGLTNSGFAGQINLQSGNNFSTKLGSDGAVISYTVINSLGVAADATTAPGVMTLQGMAAAASLTGNFVLGANVVDSNPSMSTWNAGAGFTPIGSGIGAAAFSGKFDGLGHTINNLTMNFVAGYDGLFGYASATSILRNVGITAANITGGSNVGALAGQSAGIVSNSYSTGTVSGNLNTGGLVGQNTGLIIDSYSTTAVSGTATPIALGGLVGLNYGHGGNTASIINSHASGSVNGDSAVGGLVGSMSSNGGTASISNSYATGSAIAGGNAGGAGGLVGLVDVQLGGTANITNSHATGNVQAGNNGGGLVGGWTTNGNNSVSIISGSYANTGAVTCSYFCGGLLGSINGLGGTFSITTSYAAENLIGTATNVGGLVGQSVGNGAAISITQSHASGNVSGLSNVGGLVGLNDSISSSTTIAASYATGIVTGTNYGTYTGGLVGKNTGSSNTYSASISNSYSTGQVIQGGGNYGSAGGLVGGNIGSANIAESYATGNVTRAGGNYGSKVGGLVGVNQGALISNSYSTGTVDASSEFGGLVGYNTGTLSNAFYNIDAVNINGTHQVTPGGIYNAQYLDWFGSNSALSSKTLNITNYSSSLTPGTGGYYNVGSQQGLKDLLGFSESNAGNNFRLIADISLTAGFYIPYFAGSFDGAGHTLSGLSLNLPNSMQGMFGYLPNAATSIANVAVPNVSITGNGYLGGLVGYSNNTGGTISNIYTSGSISGSQANEGGLVGYSNAAINNTYSSANVTAPAGCYGSCPPANIGGLVGGGTSLTISNSYANGYVNSSTAAGGLVGSIGSGSVTNSFYDKTVNPTLTGIGGAPDVAGSAWGMMTSAMQTSANFNSSQPGTAGNSFNDGNSSVNPNWDFTNTWIMYDGHTAPLLRAFMTPLTVTASSVTTLAGGAAFSGGNVTYSIAPGGNLLGTVNYGGSAQGASAAGTYSIIPSGLYSNQQGYAISYVTGTLTEYVVTPIYLVLLSGSSIYGSTPTFTYGYYTSPTYGVGTMIANANVAPVGTVGWSGAPTSTSGVNTYSVTPNISGITSVGVQYILSAGNAANWTIAARPVTLTGSMTYNGLNSIIGSLLSLTNTVNGDSVTVGGSGTLASANAGSQSISSLTGLTLSNANYTVVGGSGTVAVAQAPLTLTASNASKVYGQTPTLSNFTSSGLVNSETIGSVTETSAGAAVTAGVTNSPYTITPSAATGGTFAPGNYSITYVNGSLTVNPLAVSVATVANASKVYDGSSSAAASLLNVTNAINGDTVALSGSGALAGSGVGTESFNSLTGLILNNPNYTLTGGTPSGSVMVMAATGSAGSGSSASTTISTSIANAATNAITAPQITQPPSTGLPGSFLPTGGVAPGTGQPSAFVNVTNPLPFVSAAFGPGDRLAVISSPSANEPTQAVTLSQARSMMQNPGQPTAVGASDGDRDVRVPVSRNSLADIVNGGVRLPGGLEQELFVVQAN